MPCVEVVGCVVQVVPQISTTCRTPRIAPLVAPSRPATSSVLGQMAQEKKPRVRGDVLHPCMTCHAVHKPLEHVYTPKTHVQPLHAPCQPPHLTHTSSHGHVQQTHIAPYDPSYALVPLPWPWHTPVARHSPGRGAPPGARCHRHCRPRKCELQIPLPARR